MVQFDTKGAADYLGLSPYTLEKWRCWGIDGPTYYKVGSLVRYGQQDLDTWLQSRRRGSTSDPGGQREG